jgi:hypothetical protein
LVLPWWLEQDIALLGPDLDSDDEGWDCGARGSVDGVGDDDAYGSVGWGDDDACRSVDEGCEGACCCAEIGGVACCTWERSCGRFGGTGV